MAEPLGDARLQLVERDLRDGRQVWFLASAMVSQTSSTSSLSGPTLPSTCARWRSRRRRRSAHRSGAGGAAA